MSILPETLLTHAQVLIITSNSASPKWTPRDTLANSELILIMRGFFVVGVFPQRESSCEEI